MRRGKFLVSAAIGFIIILSFMVYAGFWDVVSQFFILGWKWFIIFLFLQVFLMLLWAMKWWSVLRRYNIPFKRIVPISFFGYFLNNTTPGGLAGGEPIRAYVLSKVEDISLEDSAASVIMDLFLEILPLIAMICMAIYYVITMGVSDVVFFLLGISGIFILTLLIFIILLVVNERLAELIITKIIGLVSKIPIAFLRNHAIEAKTRIDAIIENFHNAMKATLTNKKILVFGTIISTLIWTVNLFRIYLIFKMLGVDLTIPVLIVTRVTVLAVAFISILPGALGFWEGTTTLVFGFFSITASTAMAAALIERLFSFIIANIIGFIAAAYLGYNKLVENPIN